MSFIEEFYLNVIINQSSRSFVIITIISLLTYRIPLFEKILRTFHTFIHETGHSLVNLISGGKTYKIELYGNLSGVTITRSKNKLMSFFVSLSGYPFASAFAFLGYYLIIKNNTPGLFHFVLLALLCFQLIANVRNMTGVLWAITVICLLALEIIYVPEFFWATGIIISAIILFESLIMAFKILIMSYTKPNFSGDATNLKTITNIPASFWGTLFFVQAIFFSFLSVRVVLFELVY